MSHTKAPEKPKPGRCWECGATKDVRPLNGAAWICRECHFKSRQLPLPLPYTKPTLSRICGNRLDFDRMCRLGPGHIGHHLDGWVHWASLTRICGNRLDFDRMCRLGPGHIGHHLDGWVHWA
jgi:hypothetical protein